MGGNTAPARCNMNGATQRQLVALDGQHQSGGRLGEKNYKLAANIDLSGITASPIGSEAVPFSGIFDGNGHKIENLKIKKDYRKPKYRFVRCDRRHPSLT